MISDLRESWLVLYRRRSFDKMRSIAHIQVLYTHRSIKIKRVVKRLVIYAYRSLVLHHMSAVSSDLQPRTEGVDHFTLLMTSLYKAALR